MTSWMTFARRSLPLVVVAVVAACGGAAPEEAPVTTPSEVLVGPENITMVASLELATGPALSGQLQPVKSASIRAEVGASVIALNYDQGDRVAAGAVLARLDDTAIRDAWLSARSGLTAAQSSADIAQRELQRAERLVAAGAIAERDVEAARRGALAATAQLADAQARVSAAQKQLDATQVK